VGWIIFALVCFAIWLLIILSERVAAYKIAQQRRTENAAIQEALNGFDVEAEKERIIKVLKDTLPKGYRCGRNGCDGVLFKDRSNQDIYVCSKCHNIRQRITV
jgi:hypothetical protein